MEVKEDSEEEKGQEEDSEDVNEEDTPQISIHAINGLGSKGYKMIKVIVFFLKRSHYIF